MSDTGRLCVTRASRLATYYPFAARQSLLGSRRQTRIVGLLVRPVSHRCIRPHIRLAKHHDATGCTIDEATLQGQPRMGHICRIARSTEPLPESGIQEGKVTCGLSRSGDFCRCRSSHNSSHRHAAETAAWRVGMRAPGPANRLWLAAELCSSRRYPSQPLQPWERRL